MKIVTDGKKIDQLLERGMENIYPTAEAFKKVLQSGRRLKIYNGIDPSGPDLHLGHAVVLRKLRALQDLGHEIILLLGDFTGMIGDPTDKSATRIQLTRKQVLQNAKNYKKQASKILRFSGRNAVKIKYNSKWLGKLNFAEVVELAAEFTVQQMAERDMFAKRLAQGKPIHLHEFFYPLMQGYDSVALGVDAEIGGNDQTFNMLAGRTLLKKIKNKEKFVLTTKLLVDPQGKKMGKSEGNMIKLSDSPTDMYGKVMSWTDEMIVPALEILTDLDMAEIKSLALKMKQGENPKDFKMRLAKEVVTSLIGAKAAQTAESEFIKIFQKKDRPDNLPLVTLSAGKMSVVELFVATKLVSSKGEARRLLEQGGLSIDDKIMTKDVDITLQDDLILKRGKRQFVQIKLKK